MTLASYPLTRSRLNRLTLGIVVLIVAVFAQSYAGRVGIRDSLYRNCLKVTADRLISVRESQASARANRLVGTDPAQPLRTRRARLEQARANDLAARSRLMLTARTVAGRERFCQRTYPKPSPLG